MNNYTGYIRPKDENYSQFIYASQNMMTFYAIYAKFITDGDLITKIEFEIINYKGIVNIGFKSNPISSDNIKLVGSEIRLGINVRALSTNKTTEITLSPPININDADSFFVRRGLVPAHPTRGGSYYHEVFDTENYYRDGIDPPILNSIQRRGIGDVDLIALFDINIPKAISGNCVDSNMKIISP